jgi:hypothetical protein
MKINKYEFIKNELFVSKEHYLAFRQGWKDFINSGKAKPEFVEDLYSGRYKVSLLNGTHHLLLNILTEKDLSKTFRPSTKHECKRGFEDAYYHLMRLGQHAAEVVLYDKGEHVTPSYFSKEKYGDFVEGNRNTIERFLEPFGKALTVEMLATLYTDYLKDKPLTNIVIEQEQAA